MTKNHFLILSVMILMIISPIACTQTANQVPRSSDRSGSVSPTTTRLLATKPVQPERRVALVIGNGFYPASPLKNPTNDATDMADKLEILGFQVTKLLDADRRQMEMAVKDFGHELKKSGVGLFFYAGHGLQVAGVNYLVPTDAVIEKENDVQFECLEANRVLAEMEAGRNGLNIMILDACRDNPFARAFRSQYRGLAQMKAPTGTFIAFATAPGSLASDGKGRNGVFTGAFLKNMSSTGLEIEKVMKLTRNAVITQTGHKQVPWQTSSLTGDFFFAPGEKVQETVIEPLASPSPQSSSKLDEDIKAEKLRIEQEIAALEKEKQLAELEAERKRLEEEREEIKTQGANQASDSQQLVSMSSAPMTVNDEGVIYDPKTGLEWFVGPDENTKYLQARDWVENLSVGGGGWRMPSKSELKGLYQKGWGTRNMDPAFKTSGWKVWAKDTVSDEKSVWDFKLNYGSYGGYSSLDSYEIRAFAVRFRKGAKN